MNTILSPLSPQSIEIYEQLQNRGVALLSERYHSKYKAQYQPFGDENRKACQQDISYYFQFFKPVLEFGSVEPFLEFLQWQKEVLDAQNIPAERILEILQWLSEFLRDELCGTDSQIVYSALKTASDDIFLKITVPQDPVIIASEDPENNAFVTALLQGNRRQCCEIMQEYLKRWKSLPRVNVELLQPAMVDIGLRWQRNQITVARKHLASSTAQTVMADCFSRMSLPDLNGRKALFACIEGNEHALGLRMVSDTFELAGWDVQYLGPNTPTRALLAHIAEWKPDCVGLSISLSYQLGEGRRIIQLIRRKFGRQRPFILAGGLAINRFTQLAAFMDADGYSHDALSAFTHATKHLPQNTNRPLTTP